MVIVSGGFDDIRSNDIRFLEEAAQFGPLTVELASDAALGSPKFSFVERAYILSGLRFVERVVMQAPMVPGDILVVRERDACEAAEQRANDEGLAYRIIAERELGRFPPALRKQKSGRKTVAVSGCYDWLHSGHVRFFEEAATYGDLYIFLGSDATICELKGAGHPLLPEGERQYVVSSIRHVFQTCISRGSGLLDFADDVLSLKPDYFVVNEDGAKPSKAQFCEENGIAYVVLRRTPAEGLPVRSSTALRGF